MYREETIVYLECTGDHCSTEEVEFLNIEEDMQGRDLMTFKCPECGLNHSSNVFRN